MTAASDLLKQLENLRKTLNKDSEVAVQCLTIDGTYNPSAKYLPSAIATFKKTYPHVHVRFLTADRAGIEKSVRESDVDVAIVQKASRPSEVSVEVHENSVKVSDRKIWSRRHDRPNFLNSL